MDEDELRSVTKFCERILVVRAWNVRKRLLLKLL